MTLALDSTDGAGYRLVLEHLAGPLASGAVHTTVPVDEAGRATVDWPGHWPALLVAPTTALGDETLVVDAVIDPEGSATALEPLTFASFTDAGTPLVLHVPPADEVTGQADPLLVALSARYRASDGAETPVVAADLPATLTVSLLEGRFGRLLLALVQEKGQLRRETRVVRAMRTLASARDHALDALGAELGVPRFDDDLTVDGTGAVQVVPAREPDDDYRCRLGLYRQWTRATPRLLRERLNGPDDQAADGENHGVLRQLGVTERFVIDESDNAVAVAVHLVASGDPTVRDRLLGHLLRTRLLWLDDTPAADAIHAARYLPSAAATREHDLRVAVRGGFDLVDDAATQAAVAPALAVALARLAACRAALGGEGRLTLRRAQHADLGSRYELGLGADLVPLSEADLDALATAARDPGRPTADDPEVEAILASLDPRSNADDPDGKWLLRACGLRTVHRVDGGRLYVSHLPLGPLVITGPSGAVPPGATPIDATVELEAHLDAPGDPGADLVLHASLADAAAAWATHGGPAWTVLADADAPPVWAGTQALTPADPLAAVLEAAGLPPVTDPAAVRQSLERLPGELIQTLRLDAAQAGPILAGDPDAADELRVLVDTLRSAGLVSVLALPGGGAVHLVVGVIGLPVAGVNLAPRGASTIRWSVLPVGPAAGEVGPTGWRTRYRPTTAGIVAVVAVAVARRGETDPYEVRVTLPEGATLDLHQYEFVMNLLATSVPAGVEVNTWDLRRAHVRLGTTTPLGLSPTASRTFRPFRRRRFRAGGPES